MSGAIENLAIKASAGSGKTYQLSLRAIRLLALSEDVGAVLGLTFSRLAASEFSERILGRVAEAAGDPEKAAVLAQEAELPGWGCAEFCGLLRKVLDGLDRLAFGTLDSFFLGIVRRFPSELGIPSEPDILESHALDEARREAIGELLGAGGAGVVDSFRQATFGAEEKSLWKRMQDDVPKYYEVFRAAPGAEAWGDPQRIWAGGCPWLEGGEPDVDAAGELVLAHARREGTKPFITAWEKLVDVVKGLGSGGKIDKVSKVMEEVAAAADGLRAGCGSFTYSRRPYDYQGDEARAAYEILRKVMYEEIVAARERTRGLWDLLRRYDAVFRREREAGRLTFADVQRLLASGDPARLDLEFRLDARHDHWLLDEFQDTSRTQWRAISNLIDEVVQGEGRSLFYVGDVKQAIYGWRGGDARLFDQILQHYNRDAEVIETRRLVETRRCLPTVVEAVNCAFGEGSQSVIAGHLGTEVAGRWAEAWGEGGEHKAHEVGPSHARVVFANPGGSRAYQADERHRFAIALEMIREVDPLGRGLTCGVLVRRNRIGMAFADYVRAATGRAIPIEVEGDAAVGADNPLGSALLAAFHLAAHPGDTHAWWQISMGALGECLAGEGIDSPEALSGRLLAEVDASGFAPAIERLSALLEARLCGFDSFNRRRAEQLAEAAREFDLAGSRDFDRFVRFAKAYQLRERSTAGAIQVMTIHKSKGLTFDMVVVVDLEGDGMNSFGHLRLTKHGTEEEETVVVEPGSGDDEVAWVLDMPRKSIASLDPTLAAVIQENEDRASYESLCTLYVAMTRAVYATYVVANPPPKDGKNPRYAAYLRDALGSMDKDERYGEEPATLVYEAGDRDWHSRLEEGAGQGKAPSPGADAGEEPEPPKADPEVVGRRRRLHRVAPSKEHAGVISGRQIIGSGRGTGGGAEYGRHIHALFEAIGWIEDLPDGADAGDPCAGARKVWDAQFGSPTDDSDVRARDEVAACLEDQTIRRLLSREGSGSEGSELWRERPFAMLLDRELVTGVFDRVAIRLGSDGMPSTAMVIDFKSDRIDLGDVADRASSYRPQLDLYRRAAAKLLSLSEDRVSGALVFAHCCQVVEI